MGKVQNVHIFWDTFLGQPDKKRFCSLPRISQAVYSFPLLSPPFF